MAQGDNFRTHTAMINGMLTFIGDLGDQSKLSLDPEASSYNLIEPMLRVIPEITERLGKTPWQGNRHHCQGFARADGRSGTHIADGRTRSRPRGDRRPPWSCRARGDARARSASIAQRRRSRRRSARFERQATMKSCLSASDSPRPLSSTSELQRSIPYYAPRGDIRPWQRWLCWRRERPQASGNCG